MPIAVDESLDRPEEMSRGRIGALLDLRPVYSATHAIVRMLRFAFAHERRIDGEPAHAGTQQVADRVRDVERHGVVDVPSPAYVRRNREAVALAIFQKARCPTAACACRAMLVTGTFCHEEAVVAHHELLAADDDDPEGKRRLIGQQLHLVKRELGRKPDEARTERGPGADGLDIGGVHAWSDGAARARTVRASRLCSCHRNE